MTPEEKREIADKILKAIEERYGFVPLVNQVLSEDPDLFVYTRDLEDHRLLVVCNLSGHNRIYVPDEVFRHAEVLIHSGPDIHDCSPCAESGILRPYESYVLYL